MNLSWGRRIKRYLRKTDRFETKVYNNGYWLRDFRHSMDAPILRIELDKGQHRRIRKGPEWGKAREGKTSTEA